MKYRKPKCLFFNNKVLDDRHKISFNKKLNSLLVRLFNMKFNDQINEVTQYITNYS